MIQTLVSKEDASVNFVFSEGFEARYVRRNDDYIVCYLSAQSHCRQACRMCFLTATGQVNAVDASLSDLNHQADLVLAHYDALVAAGGPKANRIHYSFQARGETLASSYMLEHNQEVFRTLDCKAYHRGLLPSFCISTILPKATFSKTGSTPALLQDYFKPIFPDIYYSIYSMNPAFRKKWLPKAMPAEDALDILVEWQKYTKKIVKLHWAFIKGENDNPRDISEICAAVRQRKLRVDVNLVRYNPFSEQHGSEPDIETLRLLKTLIEDRIPEARVKLVDRIGRDVYASCGTFLSV